LDDTLNLIEPFFYGKHNFFSSITGGYVYRGIQNPSLIGKYIFADFTNKMMCVSSEDEVSCWNDMNSTTINGNYVSFGEDHNNELNVIDHVKGEILQLNTFLFDCGGISDTLHISSIDTNQYCSSDFLSIQVDSIEGVEFISKEIEILPVSSFSGSNILRIDNYCEEAEFGIKIK